MGIRQSGFPSQQRPSCNVILRPSAEESSANTGSFTSFRMTNAVFELLRHSSDEAGTVGEAI